jgi:SAM-dependent methyltransferase
MSQIPAQSPEWSKGYRTDVEYTFGLYPFMNPDTLLLTCVLQGFKPSTSILSGGANDTRGLVYCELGCGQGVTLNMLAARDPGGQYYGFDYNPNQIANARTFAKAGGITNAHFREESFEDLYKVDIPECDVIALHGIWSWISADMRQHIVAFIRRKLKPGGICYISYNCTTGRNDFPLRELLVMSERTSSHQSEDRVNDAIATAKNLADAGAGYFTQHPVAKSRLDALADKSPHYVIHEYLNADWSPTFFHQVAASLSEAKLSYVGAVDQQWNRLDLALPKEAHAFRDRFSSVHDTEFLKDIWHGTMFRKDIYVKGQKAMQPADREALIAPLRFALTKKADEVGLAFKAPIGDGMMSERHFTPALERLKKSPATGAELIALANENRTTVVNILQLLFISNQIALCVDKEAVPRISTSLARFDVATDETVERENKNYMVSQPGLGTASSISSIEYFFWRATLQGEKDKADFVQKTLSRLHQGIIHEGKPISGDAKVREFLQIKEKEFDNGLAVLMNAGK